MNVLEFELNPYNACVANKVIDGKVCTILWCIDDIKLSHEDACIVTNILDKVTERFGSMKDMPITETRGK